MRHPRSGIPPFPNRKQSGLLEGQARDHRAGWLTRWTVTIALKMGRSLGGSGTISDKSADPCDGTRATLSPRANICVEVRIAEGFSTEHADAHLGALAKRLYLLDQVCMV